MKEPKVENQMKALLEARRIKPSKGLWEHLENELPTQSSRKRKAYRIAFSLAGLLLLLLGLRFSFQELPIESPLPVQLPVVVEPTPKPDRPVVTKPQPKNDRIALVPLQLPFRSKGIEFSFIPSSSALYTPSNFAFLSTSKIDRKAINQDRLLQMETEALLDLAFQNLKTNRQKNAVQKLKALELLIAVEEELYSEIQLKTKIIDLIRSGYSKVRVATNETNP